jgi:hypothetical protein
LAVLACHVTEQRQIALHPAIDGALVDQDGAFGQLLTELGVAQAVAHVPAHGEGRWARIRRHGLCGVLDVPF